MKSADDMARLDMAITMLRKLHRNSEIQAFDQVDNEMLHTSMTPVRSLMRKSLRELCLIHPTNKKCYLVLRTLEKAKEAHGIVGTIVEDQDGNVIIFRVRNLTIDLNPNLEDMLPVATVFILKEPYIGTSKEGDKFLHCESPTNMIVVYDGHELFDLTSKITWKHVVDRNPRRELWQQPTTAREWVIHGNDWKERGQFQQATHCFVKALKMPGVAEEGKEFSDMVNCRLALVYLKRGFFENALKYAEQLLESDERFDARIIAGESCYELKKYAEAEKHFLSCSSNYLTKNEQVKKSQARIKEESTGKFDINKLLRTLQMQSLDCANYLGPINVATISTKSKKYRGMFATRNIEPGTLLVVSKAMAFSWKSDENVCSKNNLVARLAQTMAKNPSTYGKVICRLFSERVLEKDGSPKVFCDSKTMSEPIVEVRKLHEIVNKNIFSVNVENKCKGEKPWGIKLKAGYGLFEKPYYFNHSCRPNVSIHNIRDVLFIRAIQVIEAGEEVFLPYFSWKLPLSSRVTLCKELQFKCKCHLCLYDKALPEDVRHKQEQILVDLGDNLIPSNQKQTLSSKLYYSRYCIRTTGFSKLDVQEQLSWNHSFLLSFGFNYVSMLDALKKDRCVIPRGAFLCEDVFISVVSMIMICDRTGQTKQRQNWMKILCALEKIYSGGGFDVVKFKHKIV